MRFIAFLLSVLALVSIACADSGEDGGLTEELPEIALPANEVASLSRVPDWDWRVAESGFVSNAQMAAELPGNPFNMFEDLQEIRAAGRVHGYQVSYRAGPAEATAGVTIALELYGDDAAAQRALVTKPLRTSAPAAAAPPIGDASIMWLQAQTGIERTCPCHLRFRVGPLLAAVSTSYPGPSPPPELDPTKLALSMMLAERMREAVTNPEGS